MGGGNTDLNEESVVGIQTKALTTADDIDGLVRKARGQLEPVYQQWTGDAGKKFHSKAEEILVDVNRAERALRVLAMNLGAAKSTVMAGDQDASTQLDKVPHNGKIYTLG